MGQATYNPEEEAIPVKLEPKAEEKIAEATPEIKPTVETKE
jgi:hypothetical protein